MEIEQNKKQLLDYLNEIAPWEGWRSNYNSFVPKFIIEASKGGDWNEWDEHLFYEFFERSNNQCVSSLRQGYFTKEEQKAIKENWTRIAPVLQKIALTQDVPQFETYNELKDILRDYTRVDRRASTYRLIASLQPKILCTIVNHAKLNELITYLNKFVSGSQISFSYNWFESSNHVLAFFIKESGYNYKDIITYPWQLLEYFKGNHHIEDNDMSEDAGSSLKTEINLLQYKKQIILQGPPGTGKTRMAKEIAKDCIELTVDLFRKIIYKNIKISKGGDKQSYIISEVTDETIVINDSTAEHTLQIELIKKYYFDRSFLQSDLTSFDERGLLISRFIYDNILAHSEQFHLVQFHPSYSYEDFVRGIEARSAGTSVEFHNVNKILGKIINQANQNYLDSRLYNDPVKAADAVSFRTKLDRFKEVVTEAINGENGEYKIPNVTAKIMEVTDVGFRYVFPNTPNVNHNILFIDLIKLNELGVEYNTGNDVKLQEDHLEMKSKSPYYFHTYKEIESLDLDKEDKLPVATRKNYLLVIDEINRANLSSVLGELIYALEYRGEDVESMYEVGGSNKISLPPNLYIIGTMNTADRSVGHIDYAIRRRFAFVDILPKNLTGETGVTFDHELFNKVTGLFVKDYDPGIDYSIERDKLQASTHLSEEFRPEDVWLGHSYFIDKSKETDGAGMDVRLEYEIKPILLEYIRDGVLKETARAIVNALPNEVKESN
ncbi:MULTISPECIES: AAA family ATPase [Sphingobacterium]|uniref:AAA family ATPase n=1 Tax=Sphingobacterium TaxID=28453 RepID=UPI001969DEFC|nr:MULTISPECIES: AAA family ATPase [unclassified Sphingobacterium]